MPLHEKAYSVLVVSSSDKLNGIISSELAGREFEPVKIVKSVAAAQRRLAEYTYDIVIINTPLPDESGRRLAVDICSKNRTETVAMLMVSSDIYDEVYERVIDYGVYLISKPVSLNLLRQSLDWLKASRERLKRLEQKTLSLEDKMAEIRVVNKAKWKLIEDYRMSEADAHRYIEKTAMDRSLRKGEVAEDILKGGAFQP